MDFARWYKASDAYMINYKKNFEPYYVVLKTDKLPQFWEHLTGFGKNKLSWVEEMALAGYEFHVAPDCFLVHINHSHPNSEPKREVLECRYIRYVRLEKSSKLCEECCYNTWI